MLPDRMLGCEAGQLVKLVGVAAEDVCMKEEDPWDCIQLRPADPDRPLAQLGVLEGGGAQGWRRVEAGLPPTSLADRVEKNRRLVRQMLDRPLPSTPETGFFTNWESRVSLPEEKHRHEEEHQQEVQEEVSACYEEVKRLQERAQGKPRCSPLRADHALLPTWPHPPGPRPVRPQPTGSRSPRPHPPGPQPAGPQEVGPLSDASSCYSGSAPPRHGHPPARVRFEDETEREAERRHTERLALGNTGEHRGQGLLLSKPSLTSYLHGQQTLSSGQDVTAKRQEVASRRQDRTCRRQEVVSRREDVANRRPRAGPSLQNVPSGRQEVMPLRQEVSNCGSETTFSAQTIVCTERIKETYIGSEPNAPFHGGPGSWTNKGSSSTYCRMPLPAQVGVLQAAASSHAAGQTLGLPNNPYPLSNKGPPQDAAVPPSHWPCPPGRPQRGSSPSGWSLSCPGEREAEIHKTAGGMRAADDGQARGPMRVERQKNVSLSPAQEVGLDHQGAELGEQRGRGRLSLRQIFSGLRGPGGGLRGRRSCSLDLLTPRTGTPVTPQVQATKTAPKPLPRTASLQSFSLGSPLAQLRKSSSVKSLSSGPKKSNRSELYSHASPAPCRGLQRALSVEDVGAPSRARRVGRVSQACPDGSLLLELQRPPDGIYGFLLSRGRGQRDSGVYVEMDGGVEKLYAGLLGDGDEILQVNGEKVSALCLDAVTCLLTQNPSASVRVLRHHQPTH